MCSTHPVGLGIPLDLEGGGGRQRRYIIGGRWVVGEERKKKIEREKCNKNYNKEKEKETEGTRRLGILRDLYDVEGG